MWYIFLRQYYSALKKKEILSFVTTWMKLEDTMLSEISQAQKTNTASSHLYGESEKVKLINADRRLMDARAWEVGKMGEILVKSYKISVMQGLRSSSLPPSLCLSLFFVLIVSLFRTISSLLSYYWLFILLRSQHISPEWLSLLFLFKISLSSTCQPVTFIPLPDSTLFSS